MITKWLCTKGKPSVEKFIAKKKIIGLIFRYKQLKIIQQRWTLHHSIFQNSNSYEVLWCFWIGALSNFSWRCQMLEFGFYLSVNSQFLHLPNVYQSVGSKIGLIMSLNFSFFWKNPAVVFSSVANIVAELYTKDTELEGISSLTLLDISTILNCYFQPVGTKFQLLFPQAIIQSYLDDYSKSKPHYDISWLVNEHSTVMSSSDTLEHLTRTLLRFKMAWGTAQQSKIGEVFPFLSKTSVAEIPCYNLDTLNLHNKLMRATQSNKQGWESVIRKLKGTGKLGYFYDSSHSPNEFWNVVTASNTETYIEIQDKNLQGESFNLNEEIEKNEKVRLVVGDEVKLIMLFMMRSGSSLAGTYDGGVVVNGITLHKNTTVSNVNPKKKNWINYRQLGIRSSGAVHLNGESALEPTLKDTRSLLAGPEKNSMKRCHL